MNLNETLTNMPLVKGERKLIEDKIVQFETIPQLKLGFAGIGLDEIDVINKYIDDNTDRLPDLSSQLVGQI